MPAFSHEPSSLIALRDIERMEHDRRARERAAAAAQERAEAEARAAARRAEEARLAAEAEAAEAARRTREQREAEERRRAAAVAEEIRLAQAAHLARVEEELAASARATRGGRVGMWSAAALGVAGLALAFLFVGLERPTAPVLAADPEDPALAEARAAVARMRGEMAAIAADADADASELAAAIAAARQARVEDRPEPVAAPRPRPTSKPAARPDAKPTETKPQRIKLCKDLDDPLAEDC